MSGMFRTYNTPPDPLPYPFGLPAAAAEPAPAHRLTKCWCSGRHSPLEMAVLNGTRQVVTARPDAIERHADLGPGSRSAARHDATGAALARGGQAADLLQAQPEQRVRRQLGPEHFQPPKPPKPTKPAMPELYTIGDLAEALGMEESGPSVLRRWEAKGWLPRATHWTTGGAMDVGVSGAKSTGAKRRYTPEQFHGLVRIAIAERVANRSATGQARRNISETEFATRARQLFERLAEADTACRDNKAVTLASNRSKVT